MTDFTIAEFLAFCRSKPADEEYCFVNARACAIAQFGEATGRPHLVGLLSGGIPFGLCDIVNPLRGDHTFGALAERLEALVQETPAKPSQWLSPETYLSADCGKVEA